MAPTIRSDDSHLDNEYLLRQGPWQITDTVSSVRKNLFCMSPTNAFHIATIVSGSRSKIERFESSLSLIRTAPELYQLLRFEVSLVS